MSSFSFFAQARMLSASSRFFEKIVDEMPKLKRCGLLQFLHRLDRLAGLLEGVADVPHRAVHLVDAVNRDARREDHVALVAELDDLGQHRNRAVMRDAGGVERELAQLGELVDHHARDLDQIVARGRFAARDRRVLDVLPEVRAERLFDLRQRHVFLAVAARPVAAHLAAGVADKRAMEDEDRRMEGRVFRHGGPHQIAGGAHRSFREILRGVNLSHAK